MREEPPATALIAVSRQGVEQALRLGEMWPTARLCLPPHLLRQEVPPRQLWPITSTLGEQLPEIWRECSNLVFFLACGAVVRLIAPLLVNKQVDPAVVVVDGAGRYAIALLSGHVGGANHLSNAVAVALGATPIITTASDTAGLFAVDLLGKEQGWQVEGTPAALRRAAAAVVNGEPVALIVEGPWLAGVPELPPWVILLTSVTTASLHDFAALLWVTHRNQKEIDALGLPGVVVLYRPGSLILGVGCDRGTGAATIDRAIHLALHDHGLTPSQVVGVATIDRKGDEAGLLAVVREHGWPLQLLTAAELDGVATPHPSEVVKRHMGVASVAEAAALLAGGAGAILVVGKYRFRGEDGRNVTVAAARKTCG